MLKAILIAIAAVVLAFFVGLTVGRFTGVSAGKRAEQQKKQDALIAAMKDKAKAEENERLSKRELGNVYERLQTANAGRAAAVDTRLRVTVCKPGRLPETPSTGPAPNDAGTERRFEPRSVDLEDVAREIVKLGLDRDSCADKANALQAGSPGYTVGNVSP